MFGRRASVSDHAGFTRGISASSGQHALRLSIVVVATLAVAILMSAAALRLDDGVPAAGRPSQAAAWNVIHSHDLEHAAGG